MTNKKELAIFENFKIRRHYDEKTETWFFSVVDIIAALLQQSDFQAARNYWKVLKNRLKAEGSEVVTNCNRLKMKAEDGKMRETDAANPETIFRLIQSVPSPKAEPIKLWLAKVGYERIQEMADPERSVNRARENWEKHGRSKKWIQQRMMGQEVRNKLTDYWKDNEVKEQNEYAILTNIIHQEWSNLTVKGHKNLKGLKAQNLRDHMSDAELVFTALAELTTRNIAEKEKAIGFNKNAISAKKGGAVAGRAREDFELQTGKKVVSGENYLAPKRKKKEIG
ncbi:MAG: hypothetical protein ACD_7C00161G0004 [uncultured bacterium]|nr:MAG: hypothetical protein ACD_7C00161G0004 [uncultured bacterium]KKP67418.1 MAG: hypothetical protein UR66_C0015G0003 [Candidatus Moranbacteria bacterium GW2011_GWE1_35_17]KKP71936.1 MAG: hypothetical protein UR65_C0023G0003 [Candidatus Moranbacteria bacterium GW2011_GWE2_35_164]KKP81542.1 MAG: hypothetical protein UR82_C0058G0003 [Candidatus Moranbacteria bacterium GW2011_GWF1_35_5]KKP81668.1 MAG: hypothetical protein UR83_C0069G0003 [Candidatus Moranbacteria bacterium GW2011_GWF2_35_54]HB